MAKKKKKAGSSSLSSPLRDDDHDINAEAADSSLQHVAKSNAMRMRLLPTLFGSSKKMTTTSMNTPKSPTTTTATSHVSSLPSMPLEPPCKLCMGQTDAAQFNIASGEAVLLLVVERNNIGDHDVDNECDKSNRIGIDDENNKDGNDIAAIRISAAAVLELNLVDDSSTISSTTTPRRRATAAATTVPTTLRAKSTASSTRLPVVTVQVTNRSVLDCLLRSHTRAAAASIYEQAPTSNLHDEFATLSLTSPSKPVEEAVASTTTPRPSQPTPQQPQHFSFRHALANTTTSPSPRRTNADTRTTKAPGSTAGTREIECWVIACRSTWGQRLLAAETCLRMPCRRLTVEFVIQSDAKAVVLATTAMTALQRLVLAHTVGHDVRLGQVWTISYQGRPVHVRAVEAEAATTAAATSKVQATNMAATTTTTTTTTPLEEQMTRLRIEEPPNHESEETETMLALLVEKAAKVDDNVRLCTISYDTTIRIASSDSDTRTATNPLPPPDTSGESGQSLPQQRHVAGLDATLDHVRSLLLTPLLYPDVFAASRIPAPRGVLVHGPSGVGKTCLARQLGMELEAMIPNSSDSLVAATTASPTGPPAVQSTSIHTIRSLSKRVVVQYVHCSTLQSKATVVGQAEQALTALFQPSYDHHKLVVLDDVHLICAKRGGPNQSATGDRLASTLLALVDGIRTPSASTTTDTSLVPGTIVLLAITSNPSLLDPALRRPGRLDAEVEVPIPDDPSTRAEILQFQLDTLGAVVALDKNNETTKSSTTSMTKSDWLEVAKLAKGFNGADCMLAVKEAIRSAILEQWKDINAKATAQEEKLQSPSHGCIQLQLHQLQAAIRSIKPSAIKSITVEIPQVLWSSIGGMDAVKRELREAIELPSTHGVYMDRLGVPPPRGILLYGPPGCSKTLMARALATESNMNFLAVKGPELLSKWLGESERALSSLFRRARMASPAIIFFDEIDAIASKRGSGGDSSGGGGGRLLSQLLTELDGVLVHSGIGTSNSKTSKTRVVVVGATNRPDLLDSALTRPGRMDRKIYVGVPDAASRAQILTLSLRIDGHKALGNSGNNTNIDIAHLAQDDISGGFSGAELVAICRNAALLALEESDQWPVPADTSGTQRHERIPQIGMAHLLSAMQGMQRQITPSMIQFYESYRQREGKD